MLIYSTNKIIIGQIHNRPYRKMRRFARMAKNLGYYVEVKNRHKGSCYIAVSRIGDSLCSFILRFSDHSLGLYNQIPAGVINSYCTIKSCTRDLQRAISLYERLTPTEISELWSNRNIHEEYNFIHL